MCVHGHMLNNAFVNWLNGEKNHTIKSSRPHIYPCHMYIVQLPYGHFTKKNMICVNVFLLMLCS